MSTGQWTRFKVKMRSKPQIERADLKRRQNSAGQLMIVTLVGDPIGHKLELIVSFGRDAHVRFAGKLAHVFGCLALAFI